MKRLILIFIINLLVIGVYAQSPAKEIKKADYLLYDEAFDKALLAYNELEKKYPSKASSFRYHQLIAYHLTAGRGTDMEELLQFETTMGAKDEFYNYWLGRIHLLRYEFDIAISHFQAFLKMRAYKSSIILDDTKYLMKWAKEAKAFYANIDEYEIYPLDETINTAKSEVAPVFFKAHNELLFFRETDKFSNEFIMNHGFKNDDKWSEVTELDLFGKFTRYETRAELLSNDQLLFYKQENGGDIFFSEYKEKGGWTAPLEYDSKLKAKIGSDFFMNDKEDKILFSSSQGQDHVDIYQIDKRKDGTWSNPRSLNFNERDSDEDFPYLSDDEKYLYFSSNRPESIGGYDVFRVEWDEYLNDWSEPVNVGFPINTMDDELYYQMNHGSNTGYFSSNRLHSKGEFDIYYFFKIEKVSMEGSVIDSIYRQPIPNLTIKFHPFRYTDESIEASTNVNGKYLCELIANESFLVEFEIEGEIIATDSLHIDSDGFKQNFTVKLPKKHLSKIDFTSLYKGEDKYDETLERLGSKFRRSNKAVIRNIYFDFESDVISPNSETALSELLRTLQKYPDMKLTIEGHTDNVGNSDYNLKLSKQRAESVKKYLVERGIQSDRLNTVGYGETKPLASNDDEKDGRELNRRIEVLLAE